MLLFYPTTEDRLPALRREGAPEGAVLFPSLEAARQQGSGPVLVIDAEAHPSLAQAAEEAASAAGESHAPTPSMPKSRSHAPALPPSAFENLDPYCPPEPVVAAGGYVLRAGEHSQPLPARRLLLIYRRGVWDLPKGKQDLGEEVRVCALREVCEETGLGDVRMLGSLGTTVHGYREASPSEVSPSEVSPSEASPEGAPRYCVKTTHWFLMETPESDLIPERREGIEKAAWVAWRAAADRLGYATLRRHHRRVTARTRALIKSVSRGE